MKLTTISLLATALANSEVAQNLRGSSEQQDMGIWDDFTERASSLWTEAAGIATTASLSDFSTPGWVSVDQSKLRGCIRALEITQNYQNLVVALRSECNIVLPADASAVTVMDDRAITELMLDMPMECTVKLEEVCGAMVGSSSALSVSEVSSELSARAQAGRTNLWDAGDGEEFEAAIRGKGEPDRWNNGCRKENVPVGSNTAAVGISGSGGMEFYSEVTADKRGAHNGAAPWNKAQGHNSWVKVSASATAEDVWAISADGMLYYKSSFGSMTGSWQAIQANKLSDIAVSSNGKHVWATDVNGIPWYRDGGDTRPLGVWHRMDGGWWPRVEQLSVGGTDGEHVWAITKPFWGWRYLLKRDGRNGAWQNVHNVKGLVQVSVADDGSIWGVNGHGQIFLRDANGAWTNVPGGLTHVSVSGDGRNIWGVNSLRQIYHRSGVHSNNNNWANICGDMKYIAAYPEKKTPPQVNTFAGGSFRGEWVLIGSGSSASYSKSTNWQTCTDSTTTNAFTQGFELSVTVTGKPPKFFGGAELEVSAGYNQEWSREVSNTLSSCSGGDFQQSCEQSCDGSTAQVYQFITVGTSAANDEYKIEHCSFACVPTTSNKVDLTPVCPVGACNLAEGCECCRHDQWAIPAERSRVTVCPPKCLDSIGNSRSQCVVLVGNTGICHGQGGGCVDDECDGCTSP